MAGEEVTVAKEGRVGFFWAVAEGEAEAPGRGGKRFPPEGSNMPVHACRGQRADGCQVARWTEGRAHLQ